MTPSPQGRRAVVIEDHDDIRNLLAQTIGMRGFTVTTAATGLEGIEAVRRDEGNVNPNIPTGRFGVRSIPTLVVLKDGEVVMLFECKSVSTNLDKVTPTQLFRYFAVTKARIGVLTNGILYRFFSDLEAPNKMDSKPFLEFNLLDIQDSVVSELKKQDVDFAGTIRVADFNVKPGVTSDEGQGDDWPELRSRILAADILIFATPIWLGQPSSIAKRVTERMDAFLSETDEKGRMPSYGKVAVVAVVGNEDGAHHVSAELFQGLNDVGFSLAANAVTYWVGEAMHGTDYKDKEPTPEVTATTNKTVRRAARRHSGESGLTTWRAPARRAPPASADP